MKYVVTGRVQQTMVITGYHRRMAGAMPVQDAESIVLVPFGVIETDADLGAWVHEGYVVPVAEQPMPVVQPAVVPSVSVAAADVFSDAPTAASVTPLAGVPVDESVAVVVPVVMEKPSVKRRFVKRGTI